MRCKVCGIENENYMEFCKKCAAELPRDNRAPIAPSAPHGTQGMPFEPQPYDYRLPYRPASGYPEGYERPKPDPGARSYIGPRPMPSRELAVRPQAQMHSQIPPLPMPEGRVMEAPIVRIPDTHMANQHQPIPSGPRPQIARPPQSVQAEHMQHAMPQEPISNVPPQSSEPPAQPAQPVPGLEQSDAQEQFAPGFAEPSIGAEDASVEPLFDDEPKKSKQSKQPKPPKKMRDSKKKPVEEDFDDEYDDEEYEPKRSSALTVVLFVSIAVLFLAAVWFAGSYIKDEYGSIGSFVQTVLGNSPEPSAEPLSPAEQIRIDVLAEDYKGKPCHRITFYGTDGQQIELPTFTKVREIADGSAVFIASDEMFLPESPDESVGATMQAKLLANLIDADGQIYPLEVPEFEIEVPAVSLTLAKPGASTVTLDQPQLLLEGKVTDGERLVIDGSDVSELLDAMGNFSYTMENFEFGERIIVIEALAPRSRSAKATIEVNYPKREVAIQVDDSVSTSTTKDTIEIKGTMEAGALVEIEGAIEGEPTIDSSAGTFAFVGKLENYGLNRFIIKASKDNAESTSELEIEKKPDVQEYTPKARKMEYDSLSKRADEQIGRIYLCEGKVTRFLQQDPYPVFVFNVGGSSEQLIVMEYYGSTKFDEDKTYRIYGDVAGMDEEQELPKIIARFVYDKGA